MKSLVVTFLVLLFNSTCFASSLRDLYECNLSISNPSFDTDYPEFNDVDENPQINIKIKLNAEFGVKKFSEVKNIEIISQNNVTELYKHYTKVDGSAAQFSDFTFTYDKSKDSHNWVHSLGGFRFISPYLELREVSRNTWEPTLMGELDYNIGLSGKRVLYELASCSRITNQY